MDKIYVPNLSDYKCVVVQNQNTIRAYKSFPQNNNNSDYDDYYFMNHYYHTSGTQSWNQYTTLPSCISADYLTSDFWYRSDMSDILIMFTIIVLFCFGLPWRLLTIMFRRWR